MPPRTKEKVPAGRPDFSPAGAGPALPPGRAPAAPAGAGAGGAAALLDRAVDRAGDERSGDRVGGVALHDDRAARREGGGGVATGGREGEREVAGTEDRDRAERHHPLPDVGARQWRTVRHGGIDPHPEVVALRHHTGEQPQLAGRPTHLPGDPGLGQPALADGLDDDRVLVGLDLRGDGLEERTALRRAGRPVGRERLGGGAAGGGDVGLLGVGAGDDAGGLIGHGGSSQLSCWRCCPGVGVRPSSLPPCPRGSAARHARRRAGRTAAGGPARRDDRQRRDPP